jgi:hypothetical protein
MQRETGKEGSTGFTMSKPYYVATKMKTLNNMISRIHGELREEIDRINI